MLRFIRQFLHAMLTGDEVEMEVQFSTWDVVFLVVIYTLIVYGVIKIFNL